VNLHCFGHLWRCELEHQPDSAFAPPNQAALVAHPIGRYDQREILRDADEAYHFKHGPKIRDVANDAIHCAAAELNCSGFQYAIPLSTPLLDHDLTARSFCHGKVYHELC